MFRFSVLLAFIFAYLFGPSKAVPTPLKKKNLRRRVTAPTPVVANGLAALDVNHLVLDETAVHADSSDSDSDSDDGKKRRRRRKKGKRRCKHCSKNRRHKRRRSRSKSDSDSSGSDSSGYDSYSDSD